MGIFGEIGHIKASVGVIVFVPTLVALASLDTILEYIRRRAETNKYGILYERLANELLQLGIISFLLFLINTEELSRDYYIAFEFTHIVIFFIAIAFVIQACFLVQYGYRASKTFLRAIRQDIDEVMLRYREFKTKASPWEEMVFFDTPAWATFVPQLRIDMECKIFERIFLDSHKFPRNFNSAKYIQHVFRNYIARLGDISTTMWILLACLALMNYFRIKVIDSHLPGVECYGIPYITTSSILHSPNTNETLSSSSPVAHSYDAPVAYSSSSASSGTTADASNAHAMGCPNSILVYAFILSCALSLCMVAVFLAASIYFSKIIIFSFEKDGIDWSVHGRRGYAQRLGLFRTTAKVGSAIVHSVPKDTIDLVEMQQLFKDEQALKLYMKTKKNVKSKARKVSNVDDLTALAGDLAGGVQGLAEGTMEQVKLTAEEVKRQADGAKENIRSVADNIVESVRYPRSPIEKDAQSTTPQQKQVSIVIGDEDGVEENDGDDEEGNEKELTKSGKATSIKKKIKNKDLYSLFLFSYPRLFFIAVEASLFLQCVYISLTFTQLLKISYTLGNAYVIPWFFAFMLPMIFNYYILQNTIYKSVLIKVALEIEKKTFLEVCEECQFEEDSVMNLSDRIRKELTLNRIDEAEWITYIRKQYDLYDKNGDGSLDKSEFHELLGDLDVYLTVPTFNLIWSRIDYDVSGKITWDEIVVLVFPELKHMLRYSRDIAGCFTAEFATLVEVQKLDEEDPNVWSNVLRQQFQAIDVKNLGYIDKECFTIKCRSFGIVIPERILGQIFFTNRKPTGTAQDANKIYFEQFVNFVFPEKAELRSQNNSQLSFVLHGDSGESKKDEGGQEWKDPFEAGCYMM